MTHPLHPSHDCSPHDLPLAPTRGPCERTAVTLFCLSSLLGVALFCLSSLLGVVPGTFGLIMSVIRCAWIVGIPPLLFSLWGFTLAFKYWRAWWTGKSQRPLLWSMSAIYNLTLAVGTVAILEDDTLAQILNANTIGWPGAQINWLPAIACFLWFLGLSGVAIAACREVYQSTPMLEDAQEKGQDLG